MKRASSFYATALLGLALASWVSAAETAIWLPAPQRSGGRPFMEAVQLRRTGREIKRDELPRQILADLLWAAYGINRPEITHRTAPSAMNSQEIDLYVAMRQGLYLYDARSNLLHQVSTADVRGKTSGQAFGTNAPVTLLFVADLSRLDKARPETKRLYAYFDAGCISQNVYLYCASAGLATVVHDLSREPLKPLMGLKPDQEIVMAQAVGFEDPVTRPSGAR